MDIRSTPTRNHGTRHTPTDVDDFTFTEADRRAHFKRSSRAMLRTFVMGLVLFALFFGLVAACGRL